MAKIQEKKVAPSSIANLIKTYFERNALEEEVRAHKALSILHARDAQVEQLQQRLAELQSAAAHRELLERISVSAPSSLSEPPPPPPPSKSSRPASPQPPAAVPPLLLPPSPPSDILVMHQATLNRRGGAGGGGCGPRSDDDGLLDMLSDDSTASAVSSDSMYSESICDEAELAALPPPPRDFAGASPPTPTRATRPSASSPPTLTLPCASFAPPPLTPPLPAPSAPLRGKPPCHLATDGGIRPPAPWGAGGGDRETISCDDIEWRRKRKIEDTSRKRKIFQRVGAQIYPLRADLQAAVEAAMDADEELGTAMATAAMDPRAAPQQLGDGPCPRSCLTLDAQQQGEEEEADPNYSDCAAGDHASCHRLIDELKHYNKQLRAALRLANRNPAKAEQQSCLATCAAVPLPPPLPPPPATSRSAQTLAGCTSSSCATQTEAKRAADRHAQTNARRAKDAHAQTCFTLSMVADMEAERQESQKVAEKLQEERRQREELQMAHEALQTQLRHQAVVDELKRHTMEELRERLEQLERSVATDADAEADDASEDAYADARADAADENTDPEPQRPPPPQWMIDAAALYRARLRDISGSARGRGDKSGRLHAPMSECGMQAKAEAAVQVAAEGEGEAAGPEVACVAALRRRLEEAQREAEDQRAAARTLGERLAQLSKAAARELQAERRRAKRAIARGVRQRVRAVCRAAADMYGLAVSTEQLLRVGQRSNELSEASTEEWSGADEHSASTLTPVAAALRALPLASTWRRADVQAASRRLTALRKHLRVLRIKFTRAKKKIVRQDRFLKAKQVYHAFLEKTLSGLRKETEDLQRQVYATKLENDRLLERVRRLEAGEAPPPVRPGSARPCSVRPGSGRPVSPSKAGPTAAGAGMDAKGRSLLSRRRTFYLPARRSQRAISLPPPAATQGGVQHSATRPGSPGVCHSGRAAAAAPSHALLPGAASKGDLSLALRYGAVGGGANDDERRKMMNARLRAATQSIAALNKMINALRQQLQASEDNLQRCKDRLNRVEACNQNRYMLVEQYKVKTQDLEQRLELALGKSGSMTQTIESLRTSNCNLKCQLSKVTTQRDEYFQEVIHIKKSAEDELSRKTMEMQTRATADVEQKVLETKQHYARCTSEQNRKLQEAAQKLNQFGHSVEIFLKMLQQREKAKQEPTQGLAAASCVDRPQRQEALVHVADILNLTPAQLHNFMTDPGDASRRREFMQWMSYCRQLFCREVFSQLLADFLFKIAVSKFESPGDEGIPNLI